MQVEEFTYNFYAIKFYPKELRNSRKRFSVHTNDFDVARIIRTCVNIMISLYRKDPLASFGFLGSASEGEPTAATRRFKIYAYVMANFFPPDKFQHAEHQAQSMYAMFNRNNQEPDLLQKIEAVITEVYHQDPPIQFTAV